MKTILAIVLIVMAASCASMGFAVAYEIIKDARKK